jgi:hypothetical protein
VRKTTLEKELRGLSIVPVAIGEPITSEVLQRFQRPRKRRRRRRRRARGEVLKRGKRMGNPILEEWD